jgi:hypothetical protein
MTNFHVADTSGHLRRVNPRFANGRAEVCATEVAQKAINAAFRAARLTRPSALQINRCTPEFSGRLAAPAGFPCYYGRIRG